MIRYIQKNLKCEYMRVAFIIILVMLTCCYGCTKFLMSAYGVKNPRLLNEDEISLRAKELHISDENSFILDKKYFYALEKKDTSEPLFGNKCSPMISKYLQPLQVMYFDESGRLLSFHNNCYAQGFPKLKWNTRDQFNSFIPVTTIPITDSVLNMELLLTYLRPINDKGIYQKAKWTVIVFWCDFMLKQSKELIRVARENLIKDNSKTARIYFVNVDNCYVDDKYVNQINKIE